VEHRAVIVTVLSEFTNEKCLNIFCELGGLRVLKNWLKIAIEDGHIEHLTRIVKLCNILPFNRNAVKQSEIGKTIKRILKYKGDSQNIVTLHNEVNKLINKWTEQLRSNSDSRAQSSQESIVFENSSLPSIVHEMENKIKNHEDAIRIAKLEVISTPVTCDTSSGVSNKALSTKIQESSNGLYDLSLSLSFLIFNLSFRSFEAKS
jgi:hypothetical protein